MARERGSGSDGQDLLGGAAARRRGADPRTLLSEDAAELLATAPARPARAFLYGLAALLAAAVAWATFAPLEAVVVARGSLVGAPLAFEARVPAAEADRLRPGQAARVFLISANGPAAARKGSVIRVDGPVAEPDGLSFVAVVSIDDAFIDVGGERRPLVPGLGATVEIATGPTTPLGWLLGHVRP
jgi:hypothetical protein